MTKELKDFLNKIINSNLPLNFREEAKEYLLDDFKKDIITTFNYHLTDYHAVDRVKDIIRKRNKCDFLQQLYYYDGINDFINEYWNDMDLVMDILNKYLDELEKEKENEDE